MFGGDTSYVLRPWTPFKCSTMFYWISHPTEWLLFPISYRLNSRQYSTIYTYVYVRVYFIIPSSQSHPGASIAFCDTSVHIPFRFWFCDPVVIEPICYRRYESNPTDKREQYDWITEKNGRDSCLMHKRTYVQSVHVSFHLEDLPSFFWHGAALFRVLEKPARHLSRQWQGFIRPPLRPMPPPLWASYGGTTSRPPHKLLLSEK